MSRTEGLFSTDWASDEFRLTAGGGWQFSRQRQRQVWLVSTEVLTVAEIFRQNISGRRESGTAFVLLLLTAVHYSNEKELPEYPIDVVGI